MRGLFITFLLTTFLIHVYLKVKLYEEDNLLALIQTNGKYTCQYSALWCKCSSAGSGCELGCTSSLVKILYNQTSCPHYDKLILSGFY